MLQRMILSIITLIIATAPRVLPAEDAAAYCTVVSAWVQDTIAYEATEWRAPEAERRVEPAARAARFYVIARELGMTDDRGTQASEYAQKFLKDNDEGIAELLGRYEGLGLSTEQVSKTVALIALGNCRRDDLRTRLSETPDFELGGKSEKPPPTPTPGEPKN
jgi:hypothetical protein